MCVCVCICGGVLHECASICTCMCKCICVWMYVCVRGPRLILVFLDVLHLVYWGGVSHLNSTLPDTACLFSRLALGDPISVSCVLGFQKGHSPFDCHTVLGIHALVLVLMWQALYPASCLYPDYYVYDIWRKVRCQMLIGVGAGYQHSTQH